MTVRSLPLKLALVVAVAGVLAAVAACRGGGANPGTVTIPVINPTSPPERCQTDYPQDAPAFGDNSSFSYQTADVAFGNGVAKLKYFDHEVGAGDSPANDSVVLVHYTGWLNPSCVFDYDWDNEFPARFSVNQVIPGWSEGIKTMKVGGKRRLEIPPELGYGPIGSPPVIPQNATLYFEVELLDVLTPVEATATISAIITAEASARDTTATAFSLTATAVAPTPNPQTATAQALTPTATARP